MEKNTITNSDVDLLTDVEKQFVIKRQNSKKKNESGYCHWVK